jgi:hypothetical protein
MLFLRTYIYELWYFLLYLYFADSIANALKFIKKVFTMPVYIKIINFGIKNN